MAWDEIEYLKKQSTRELLSLRNACHKFNGYYCVSDHSCPVHIENVLTELNTREHIPAKKEAKLLRRLMSQNKMTAEQVRAIPKFATMLAQEQPRRIVSADMFNQYKMAAPGCWVTKKMLVLPTK